MTEVILKNGSDGSTGKILSSGRLTTSAVSEALDAHQNSTAHGTYYMVVFSQAPTATGDCIFWMKNADDKDLCISAVFAYSTVATRIVLNTGDIGTANVPTSITPINLNTGSGNEASGTFYYGADLDNAGAGLAGGNDVFKYRITASTQSSLPIPPNIVLQKNKTFSIYVEQGAPTAVEFNIGMFYRGDCTE